MNHKAIYEEIIRQLHICIGTLVAVDGHDPIDDEMILRVKAELIGIVKGIENIERFVPESKPFPKAMTIGQLKQAQFDRATEVETIPEKDCSDAYPGLY